MSHRMNASASTRITEQRTTFDAALVRQFIHAALAHDAAIDRVLDLLHDHADRRYHSSVVAVSLKPILEEIIGAATGDDWQLIADQLIADARDSLLD